MTRRFPFRWWMFLAAAAVFGLACNLTGGTEQPTSTAEPPIIEIEATAVSATTEEPDIVEPTATGAAPAATATLPGDSESEQPTATLEATEEPTSIFEPTVTVTVSETVEPVKAAPGSIAPGQQASGSLESGGAQFFSFQGTKFKPALVFVEGAGGLDVAASAYLGTIENAAALAQLTPLSEADFSPAGWPEALVITPNEDGAYTIVIQSSGASEGDFSLYMFDGTTPAANARLINDSLAAGETKHYETVSNEGRPLVVFADQTGQSDLVIQILFESGGVAGEANFGGPNSAETLFVLPEGTTTYAVSVSTFNGEAAVYDLVIVTLD
jgi:hypothetical protein